MKCSECDGTAKMQICEKCHYFEGIQTNEEWLRQVTTEQLAEFLCNVGFENETIVRKFKSEWVEWLKQPHREG